MKDLTMDQLIFEPETTTYFRHKKSFLRNTYQNWHSKTVFIFYENVNDLEMMDRLFIKYHAFTFHARTQIALLVESQTTYWELLKISSTNSLRTSMGRVVIPVEKHERRGILVYSTWNRDKTRRHALRMRLKIRRSPTFLEAKTYKHPFGKGMRNNNNNNNKTTNTLTQMRRWQEWSTYAILQVMPFIWGN